MRKLIVAMVLIAVVALPGFTIGLEVGLSGTPVPNGDGGAEWILGAHLGVSPWAILYASWDALVMPPGAISGMTGYVDDGGYWHDGPRLPGFLNLFDVGIKFEISKVVLLAEMGVNTVYVYKQEGTMDFGANLRVGAGLRFGGWGVTLTGTSVFGSMDTLVNTLKGLVADSTRKWAFDQIVNSLVPSIMAVVYF
jgi:hypothetical protein